MPAAAPHRLKHLSPREFEAELRQVIYSRDTSCPRCGYNLSGMTGHRCPECGRNVTESLRLADLAPHRLRALRLKRRIRRAAIGVLVLALLALCVFFAAWAHRRWGR